MKNAKTPAHRGGPRWGLLVVPVATPEVIQNYAPYALAGALMLSGVQLLLARNFRVGSLIVGASLCLMLSAGVIGK